MLSLVEIPLLKGALLGLARGIFGYSKHTGEKFSIPRFVASIGLSALMGAIFYNLYGEAGLEMPEAEFVLASITTWFMTSIIEDKAIK